MKLTFIYPDYGGAINIHDDGHTVMEDEDEARVSLKMDRSDYAPHVLKHVADRLIFTITLAEYRELENFRAIWSVRECYWVYDDAHERPMEDAVLELEIEGKLDIINISRQHNECYDKTKGIAEVSYLLWKSQ